MRESAGRLSPVRTNSYQAPSVYLYCVFPQDFCSKFDTQRAWLVRGQEVSDGQEQALLLCHAIICLLATQFGVELSRVRGTWSLNRTIEKSEADRAYDRELQDRPALEHHAPLPGGRHWTHAGGLQVRLA